ncbi:MAG: hypothetical protein OSJ72_01120 [Lachnospiraceae bacterium]|nr:hypothetical protein [Lachnospiraceae bacterium]
MEEKPKRNKRLTVIVSLTAVILLATVLIAAVTVYRIINTAPEGCFDYTIQKQQYYVEYSEQYDYLDVLTIEYPVLEESEESQGQLEHLQQINDAFYETAMERVNYWHLQPDDEVKRAQEAYHMFTADVQCDVPYHSQYLVSAHFWETDSPIYPVWYIFKTQRGMTADLLTGECYALADILRVDEDFIKLWIEKLNQRQGEEVIAPEDADIMLDWFRGSDEEIAEKYQFVPYFYLTEDGVFVIGISLDAKLKGISGYGVFDSTFYANMTAEELAPYRTEALFWERYDKAQSAGEVRECEEKQQNIWLGEEGGATKYWEDR